MIEWHRCEDKLPNDRQECLLFSDEAERCVGPIQWVETIGAWCDPFATAEAGHAFKPGPGEGKPTHWAIWNGPRTE